MKPPVSTGANLSMGLSIGKPTIIQGPPPARVASAAAPTTSADDATLSAGTLRIQATEAEVSYLTRKAEARKLSLHEYIRRCLFGS